jgi:hypothetical protein
LHLDVVLNKTFFKPEKNGTQVQNVKKMPLAGVNIARAVALVEDCCCFRYAANAIQAPLASPHRAVRRFQETD